MINEIRGQIKTCLISAGIPGTNVHPEKVDLSRHPATPQAVFQLGKEKSAPFWMTLFFNDVDVYKRLIISRSRRIPIDVLVRAGGWAEAESILSLFQAAMKNGFWNQDGLWVESSGGEVEWEEDESRLNAAVIFKLPLVFHGWTYTVRPVGRIEKIVAQIATPATSGTVTIPKEVLAEMIVQ